MSNQYMSAEQALELANIYFNKKDFNQSLQHFEYADKIRPSINSQMGIILLKLAINRDLLGALDSISSLTSIQYPDEIFKAYQAAIALHYYNPQLFWENSMDEARASDITRVCIENYLTNEFNGLQKQVGINNADKLRIMLLKVLLQSYNNILLGEVFIGREELADTYNVKTQGISKDYGYFIKTRLNTTVEKQKNYRSNFMRNIDFLEETTNELNFKVRCKEITDEIHNADPYYDESKETDIKNFNYLLSGYLKYFSYKNLEKADKKRTKILGLFLFFGLTAVAFSLLSLVIKDDAANLFRNICWIVTLIFFLSYIKIRISTKKYKNGEYEICTENIKIDKPHSNM